MTMACGYEDVVLAHAERELLIFPYSHNILDVIAAPMDPKGKVVAPIYGVINMVGQSKKWKAPTVEPTNSARSSKEVRAVTTTDVAGAAAATGGALAPLGVCKCNQALEGFGD